ncbi:MAG: SpoIIE family protein phosphatase [Polyangiaceae bacterium]|nr:SpoIIE family protein phosphatase [Polyangiaceae bacterium]
MSVRVGIDSRPRTGETSNGDTAVSRRVGGRHLLAVVDGLGHGPDAQTAADAARSCLEQAALSGPIAVLLRELHAALRPTRGAAAFVAVVDGHTLVGAGVGNVDARMRIGRIPLVLTPGVLGMRMTEPKVFQARFAAGDRLAIFSDGVRATFDLDETRTLPPEQAAKAIVDRYGRHHDDATVLVADLEQ